MQPQSDKSFLDRIRDWWRGIGGHSEKASASNNPEITSTPPAPTTSAPDVAPGAAHGDSGKVGEVTTAATDATVLASDQVIQEPPVEHLPPLSGLRETMGFGEETPDSATTEVNPADVALDADERPSKHVALSANEMIDEPGTGETPDSEGPLPVSTEAGEIPEVAQPSGYAEGLIGDFGTFGLRDVNASDLSYLDDVDERTYSFTPSPASEAAIRDIASNATGDLGVDSVGDLDFGDAGSLTPSKAPATGERPARSSSAKVPPVGSVHGESDGSCPTEYPIKGNGTSKVYHVPASPSYHGTKAEWCFSSEDAAISAGFRAPSGHRAIGGKSGPTKADSANNDLPSRNG